MNLKRNRHSRNVGQKVYEKKIQEKLLLFNPVASEKRIISTCLQEMFRILKGYNKASTSQHAFRLSSEQKKSLL
jgi:hypothetical protein